MFILRERIMKKVVTAIGTLFCISLLLLPVEQMPAETTIKGEKIDLVGVTRCKGCHNRKSTGKQYKVWKNGPHAHAYKRLATAEAQKVAQSLGIPDPLKNSKCLKCHATTYYFTETPVEHIDIEEGVSCESCHAPGQHYSQKTIMKNRELAVSKGLEPDSTRTCVSCHNKSNPNWRDDRYTLKDGTKTGFDLEQALEKIAHPNPKKKK